VRECAYAPRNALARIGLSVLNIPGSIPVAMRPRHVRACHMTTSGD
jgi:hypothetical protein